jgi:Zn-dependent membrane protease YugP
VHFLILLILLVLLLLGPGAWVRHTLARYDRPKDRYEGTGAELARYLLDREGLDAVHIETTGDGDHYDPGTRTIRLKTAHHDGRSLTALTIAAHEVGHAVQHSQSYTPLALRTKLVRCVRPIERFGAALLMLSPLIAVTTRAPLVTTLMIAGGLLSLVTSTLVHLLTLPTEFDASFARAMPLLKQERALYESDYRHARRILFAAAMTYVAASLFSLLNVTRWWRLLWR